MYFTNLVWVVLALKALEEVLPRKKVIKLLYVIKLARNILQTAHDYVCQWSKTASRFVFTLSHQVDARNFVGQGVRSNVGAKFQSKGTSLQRGATIMNSSFTWLRLLSNYGWKWLRFRILLKTTLITGYTALFNLQSLGVLNAYLISYNQWLRSASEIDPRLLKRFSSNAMLWVNSSR